MNKVGTLSNLEEIRQKLTELNYYPEIIGNETKDYPETKIEKAYCHLLWLIHEEIRKK